MARRAFAVPASSVVILAGAVLLLPLLRHDGLVGAWDVFLHLGNVVECSYLLQNGKLPPFDWVPDIAGGRGGPNYLYYGSGGFLGPA